MKKQIFVGFDQKEIAAFCVAVNSIARRSPTLPLPKALVLSTLIKRGLYTRPTEVRDGRLYDAVSAHPMSTEFAISRFFAPYLAETGWALATDCDVLARADLEELFALADPRYAVMCVKHDHQPDSSVKMDGQLQSWYPRKNWSSVCLWNCDHPANKQLTPKYINSQTGKSLHGFSHLTPEEIGELPVEYNFLVGVSPYIVEPKLVHFTNGTPHMRGYEACAYSDEWRAELMGLIPGVLSALGTLPA